MSAAAGTCSLWLALGAFAMRSAGCVYNDIVDRDLDRQVERTRLRPLASGRVSLRSAWVLIGLLCLIGLVVLLQLNRTARDRRARQPRAGRRLSLHEAHHLVAAGVARAGLLLGRAGRLAGGDRSARLAALLLWFGSIAWVIGYDTLYAIQDIEDDALVGVKSSARRLGDKAPLGVGDLLRARAASLGRGDLVRAARLVRAGRAAFRLPSTSPTRRSAPIPKDGELALRLFRSNRTLRLARLPRDAGRRPFRRARRARHAISRTRTQRSPNRSSSAASQAGATAADALYVGSRSSSVQVRLGELEAVSRSEGEEIGLRLFVGQRSATVASSDLSDEALGTLVERCLAMAREAPEDPYAGLAPQELLATRRSARARRASIARSRIRRNFAHARSRRRTRRSPLTGVTNSSGAGASASAHRSSRLRPPAAFPAPTDAAATAARPRVVAGEGATMQRDHAWHSARHPRGPRGCRGDRPAAGRARRRTARTRHGRSRANIRSSSTRASRRRLLGHFAGAISGSSIARKTSFLQDKLGAGVRAAASRSSTIRCACAAFGRGRSTAKACASRGKSLCRTACCNSWIAESASARQLGIEPTGHAARGVSGAPGASPSNFYLAAGERSREELLAAFPRSGADHRADRAGRERA